MGLLTSFGVGVQALRSAQSGLNTTAHNLSNTKTEGYTRQQNMHVDMPYMNIKETNKATLQVGLGTSVSAIRQIRDMFLDTEYRYEVSRQTFYEEQYEAVTEIEDVLGEMEGVEFRSALNDMWDQIQTLSTSPDNVVYRELFISRAESFIEKAKKAYQALTIYQDGMNEDIKGQVDEINSISDKIANLNTLISMAEATGAENANDYRDARNLLMDRLAELTYYDYSEDVDGKVQIYIRNAPLVTESRGYHMHCEQIDDDTNMYKPVWSDNGFGDVYDLEEAYSTAKKTDTGSLLGLLTARGSDEGTYRDIPEAPIVPTDSNWKEIYGNRDMGEAGGTAGTQPQNLTDAQKLYDVDYHNFEQDVKVFNNTTGNSIVMKVEAQFDRLIHGVVTMMNDVFCPNTKMVSATTSGTPPVTTETPITSLTINGTVYGDGKNAIKVLDVKNCPAGTDDASTIGEELFARTGSPRYNIVTFTQAQAAAAGITADMLNKYAQYNEDTKEYSMYIYNEEADDFASQYSLNNLEVNDKLLKNYSLLPVKETPVDGDTSAYAQWIYPDLLEKWQSDFAAVDPNMLTIYKYDDYYSQLVGHLSMQGMVWHGILEDQTVQTENIEDKRQQVAGVSGDEELINMLTYQHAYNAASRYINTIDQMLQNIIERLA